MWGYLKLMRWFHEVVAMVPFMAVLLCMRIASDTDSWYLLPNGYPILLVVGTVMAFLSAGCVMNDLADMKIDAINKQYTRVIGRIVTPSEAWVLCALLLLTGVYFSYQLTLDYLTYWWIIAGVILIATLAYNFFLKRTPLFGNLLMGMFGASIVLVLRPFVSEYISAENKEAIFQLIDAFAVWSFLIIVPRELSLDISDMEGDKAIDCKTFPLIFGEKASKYTVTCMLGSVPFISAFWCSLHPNFIAIAFVVNLALIPYIIWFWRCTTRLQYIQAGRYLWGVMIVGLIGIWWTVYQTIGG